MGDFPHPDTLMQCMRTIFKLLLQSCYQGTKFKNWQDLWACPSFRRHIIQDAEIVPNTCCKQRGHGRESKFSKNFRVKKLLSVVMANVTRLGSTAKNLCYFLLEMIRVTSWKLK